MVFIHWAIGLWLHTYKVPFYEGILCTGQGENALSALVIVEMGQAAVLPVPSRGRD